MSFQILQGDALDILKGLADASVNCCVTSPPYFGLRDYGVADQIGLESTPDEYVACLVNVFREVRRVLSADGTCWLNLGDSFSKAVTNNGGYSDKSTLAGFTSIATKGRVANEHGERKRVDCGLKPKNLIGVPWRVAFALQADGWYLRSDIIWSKPNPMPESVTDRPTKAHEYIFLLAKSQKYYYDADAIAEGIGNPRKSGNKTQKYVTAYEESETEELRTKAGLTKCGGIAYETRNKRTVWTVATHPYSDAHFACFPPKLIEPCILAGCQIGGTVLDPFSGSGTTGMVALRHGRKYIGIELNPEYVAMSKRRIFGDSPLLNCEVSA